MADSQQLDMFSYLPFVLVIKIISLLTFSQAYKLCLLRPEWLEAQLWRHCCSIDLHEKFHLSRAAMRHQLRLGQQVSAREIKDIGRVNFQHLADRVIPLVESERLGTFSLQISFTSNLTKLVDKWLSIVLPKQIKEMTLDFADRDTIAPNQTDSYEVPIFFFQGHEWITIIRLFSCVIPFELNFRRFTNLTTLVLHGIRFKGITVNDSFVGCALLENLFIVECFGILKVELGLEMISLCKLVVQDCESIEGGIEFIDTLQLRYFEYRGALIRFYFSRAFELENVILDFVAASYPYHYLEIGSYFSRIFYPKYFTITTPALKVFPLQYMSRAPPMSLLNVDILTIKTSMELFEMPAILCLLKGARYMRCLIFVPFKLSADMVDLHNASYQHFRLPTGFWNPDENDAALPCLERVEFGGFSGRELEYKVLNLILKCAKMLQKVVLKPRRGMDIHQLASSDQFRALVTDNAAGYSPVKFEWRYG